MTQEEIMYLRTTYPEVITKEHYYADGNTDYLTGFRQEGIISPVFIKKLNRPNKEISKVSETTAIFIQAIKALGKENVTEQIIEHLKTYVNENQKVQMLEEAKPVTAWVYEIIKKICK